MNKLINELKKLSSNTVADRMDAINNLQNYLSHPEGHLARLALYYVAHHDPNPVIKRLARQVIGINSTAPENFAWESSCSCYGINCHHKD